MKYNKLGRSGLLVSEYCFGAANLGTPLPQFAIAPHLDEAQTAEAVAIALDNGVNFFDTADLYSQGDAERILGSALSAHRTDVVISTKVGLRVGQPVTASGLSRRHILASVDGSLHRLGTDWIDIYMAHCPDPHTPLEETLEALDDIVRAGKVRYLGYSNWPTWLAAKAVGLQLSNGWAPFVTAQLYYSLLSRELESDTIPFLIDAGIGLMAWSPLAGGYLTGKYSRPGTDEEGGRLSRFNFLPLDTDKGDRVVEVLHAVAQRHATTPACAALAWLTRQQGLASVMLGVSSAPMLSTNLAAASIVLTDEDLAELGFVSECPVPYPDWYNNLMADPVVASALTRQ